MYRRNASRTNPAALSPAKLATIFEGQLRRARGELLPEDGWVETTDFDIRGFVKTGEYNHTIPLNRDGSRFPAHLWATPHFAIVYLHPLHPLSFGSSKGRFMAFHKGPQGKWEHRVVRDAPEGAVLSVCRLKFALRFVARTVAATPSDLEACWKALRTPAEARFRAGPLGVRSEWATPTEYTIPLGEGRTVVFTVTGADDPMVSIRWSVYLRSMVATCLPVGPTPRFKSPQQAWDHLESSLKIWGSDIASLGYRYRNPDPDGEG